jgi:hypothetical protein
MAARALVLLRPLNRFFSIIEERWINNGSIPSLMDYGRWATHCLVCA